MTTECAPAPTTGIDDALARALRPGQSIVVGQAWGEPRTLVAALSRHRDQLVGSQIFVGMLVGSLPLLPEASIETFFPSGPLGTVDGLGQYRATYRRSTLFDLATAFRTGRNRVDVVLAQAGPSCDGRRSLGLSVDFLQPAAEQAEVVVLETRAGIPWTGPASTIAEDRAIVCGADRGPITFERVASEREGAIAERVAEWIPDGATLQLGMAAWVDPLVTRLRDRRGLRVHSGLLGDWVMALDDVGALDPSSPIVGTGAGGTSSFYRWLDGARRAELRPADRTHSPETLSSLPLLRAVNSVLEVDLDGNVNCEIGRGGRRGGIAGLQDFATVAAARDDALSIIALSASARSGSRIVPSLPTSSTSLPPGSVDIVVTEHGTADLRGATPAERAVALIGVAAPEHRDALRDAAGTKATP